jgi:2-keto-4-pentenoate hydratase/2-oxohepta-3-ene-1,7-dioic acid hydratase in catechol pathway
MAETIAIAPLSEALTFARIREQTGHRVVAVTSYREGRIGGVDLSALTNGPDDDAIDLFNRLDYASLEAAILKADNLIETQAGNLDMPVKLGDAHIAVGTNYREHANESTVKGGPFLFPKMVVPTSSRTPVSAGEALLDYEVELSLVTMTPLAASDGPAGGLILCNDFTDRALLMRHIDPRNPQSGRGFTTGKSAPGYLPVGDLFVVPRDLDSFVAKLTLQLSVNGAERQHGPATDWIWNFRDIPREARQRRDTHWAYRSGEVRLPFDGDGTIPARTLLMAGTPAGTVFQGLSAADYLLGIRDFLLRGGRRPIVSCLIERHIARARARRSYLQPGDRVDIRVDYLGALSNLIGE